MFCKNCGKEIEDGAKFCPACGTAQGVSESAKGSGNVSNNEFFHNWIMENNLESCEQILKSEGFDTEDVLVGLTAPDLDRIDVLGGGDKVKILNAVQKLRSANHVYAARKELVGKDGIPNRCPNCGEMWGMAKENAGAGNTLGKALIGGLLLGPIGAVGGAAFGNKTTVYICNKCGFKKQYKSSLVKGAVSSIKNMFS
ncbi:MAG: zinc-ribbon domain-containing protein [Treponemataceae bacterium]|nr:zinc-ribbon domain-containing protein [Treponemataceae bacterium]